MLSVRAKLEKSSRKPKRFNFAEILFIIWTKRPYQVKYDGFSSNIDRTCCSSSFQNSSCTFTTIKSFVDKTRRYSRPVFRQKTLKTVQIRRPMF